MKDETPTNTIDDLRDDLDDRIADGAKKALLLNRALPQPKINEPDDERLLLYLDGKLAGAQEAAFERSLEHFPYTRHRLEIIREAMSEVEPAAPEPDPLRAQLVFALHRGASRLLDFVRGSAAPMAMPAFAVRGEIGAEADETFCFQHAFGNHQANIRVQSLGEETVGLCLQLSREGQTIDKGRVSLRKAGRLVESVAFCKGAADFRNLSPGSYELEFKAEGRAVGQLNLEMLATQ